MRTLVLASVSMALLACSDTPPVLVAESHGPESVTWLHDTFAFQFDEQLGDYDATFLDGEGQWLAGVGTRDARSDQARAVCYLCEPRTGELYLELEVTNANGSAAVVSRMYSLEPWASYALGEQATVAMFVDGGAPWEGGDFGRPPAVLLAADRAASTLLSRAVRDGAWQEVDAEPLTVSADVDAFIEQDGASVVAWSDAEQQLHLATSNSWGGWDAVEIEREGSRPSVAVTSTGAPIVVAVTPTDRPVLYWQTENGGIPSWEPRFFPVTELVGWPELAIGWDDQFVVAYLDQFGPAQTYLRVFRRIDSVWFELLAEPVEPVEGTVSMLAHGPRTFVAWADATGVRVLAIETSGATELEVPDTASGAIRPRLSPGGAGRPALTWFVPDEGESGAGHVALWRDDRWETLEGPWESSRCSTSPNVSWWRDDVPVVGWTADGVPHVALYNGPAE